MPITRDRLVNLVNITDKVIKAQNRVRTEWNEELSALLKRGENLSESENELFSDIIRELYKFTEILSDPLLSFDEHLLVTLELKNLKANERHAEKSAQAMREMRRKRHEAELN